jgi:cobyrinic acid a,c-diamide synthase
MGLYDGATGESEAGSTAQLAKILGLPVVLVLDASKSSRSVGATALGFKAFDPEVNLAGAILNGIAGEMHLALARPSLAAVGIRCLGYLPGSQQFALPERHLGLIPTAEGAVAREYYGRLAEQAEATLEVETVLRAGQVSEAAGHGPSELFPDVPARPRAALAVAMDAAFNFYYPDSLDLLEAWGAEIVPFSPLADAALPEGAGGVYFGGGFPELYARELSENKGMLRSITSAARQGIAIYAECGGLMYLCQGIEDLEGRFFPMAGLLPGRSVMPGSRLTLGYRTVQALEDTPLLAAGERARGHEFHLSAHRSASPAPEPTIRSAYAVLDQPGRREGFLRDNVLASYVHLHFGTKATIAPRFVGVCARAGDG